MSKKSHAKKVERERRRLAMKNRATKRVAVDLNASYAGMEIDPTTGVMTVRVMSGVNAALFASEKF